MKIERVMTPTQLRNQLIIASELAKIGMGFVVIPVLNTQDKNNFSLSQYRRLQQLEQASDG